jgi:hypothetical protein
MRSRTSTLAHTNYENWKHRFVEWLHFEGKDPERLRGYADETDSEDELHDRPDNAVAVERAWLHDAALA